MVPFIVAKITALQPLAHLAFAVEPMILAGGTTRFDTQRGCAMTLASANKVQSFPNLVRTASCVSTVSCG
jgi:hypothetical protein